MVGVPYGYLATGAASSGCASERLGQTTAATTYYATASPADYGPGPAVGVVSIPRAAGAPTSPPIRGDQYVLQRILHGQASRSGSGILSVHDLNNTELAGISSFI